MGVGYRNFRLTEVSVVNLSTATLPELLHRQSSEWLATSTRLRPGLVLTGKTWRSLPGPILHFFVRQQHCQRTWSLLSHTCLVHMQEKFVKAKIHMLPYYDQAAINQNTLLTKKINTNTDLLFMEAFDKHIIVLLIIPRHYRWPPTFAGVGWHGQL